MPSTDAPIRSTVVPSPLTCLASSSVSSTQIAVAGREVDVGIYDVERLFAVDRALPAKQKPKASQAKLEDGQVWGAKNVTLCLMMINADIQLTCTAAKYQSKSTRPRTSPRPHLQPSHRDLSLQRYEDWLGTTL